MYSLLGITTLAQDQSSSGKGLEAVIQVITVAGAVIALISAFVQYLQTRIRPSSEPDLSPLRLHTTMGSPKYRRPPTDSEKTALRFTELMSRPGIMLVTALFHSGFTLISGYLLISERQLIYIIGVLEFGLFALLSWALYFQYRQVKPGKPFDRKRATLIVKADLATAVSACQRALTGFRGATIHSKPSRDGQQAQSFWKPAFEAGQQRQAGPPRGQRVSFRVRRWFDSYCSIEVESASFQPGFFEKRRNASAVKQILRILL
jgi:hypothetical protein